MLLVQTVVFIHKPSFLLTRNEQPQNRQENNCKVQGGGWAVDCFFAGWLASWSSALKMKAWKDFDPPTPLAVVS